MAWGLRCWGLMPPIPSLAILKFLPAAGITGIIGRGRVSWLGLWLQAGLTCLDSGVRPDCVLQRWG